MKALQKLFDNLKPNFEKGGKWEKFYTLYEGHRTIVFAPDLITGNKGAQIKDAVDLKRIMITVVIAMIPALLFGVWNVGHQHFISIGEEATLLDKLWIGAYAVVPILIVSYAVGLLTEFIFCVIRNHPISEGYLVTGMLIALIVPPTIPLWQVALATIFAVVIGKEAFGGTGMNILNVALTARAFLYFAYPSDISGEVWTYFGDKMPVDGYSGATVLAYGATAASNGTNMMADLAGHWSAEMFSFWNMFIGIIPGSIGETSTLMCLIGAAILIGTGVGSWKIIFSVFGGAYAMGLLFNAVGGNSYMDFPAHYHLVAGGLAFGAVYMATDPVSAAQTEVGKWIYGFLIGVLTVLIRVVNPAYPEGIMLAVLFMNVFAPLIDYYVVDANKKRRLKRATV
ncbi:NADH:ubiquinone reductase (Na(+)-transporting) subunit B [Marinoscillum furvescens]|uniref:Na(+)-translocating NADH-quinone reductase subunit B n=1 Tax=Marinoscillum furvescens DSM 4134 TaxID=1122208 RepID=A0A3D9KY78_MARFU|nr:NADH:ubiquinone reductase (Na(+)-transporting) subunit B [Marinoscillum furvescens]RED93191.1 Na(+)-translocating NADH:ubiquinone oxidoreductase B subunit [Marinoscillum furvescens DSM 4134]